MTRIWERLFVGGLSDAQRLARGNPNHIDTVISLCEACVASKRQGVNYIHIPIEDDQSVPAGQFDSIIDAIAKNVRWGTVLLHCGVGVSRAPSLTAAWMYCVGYKNLDSALEEIKRLRPAIDPSTILLESIRSYL